ncbi:phosphoribosylaminoimidazole carboxylase, ATPase subunit [Actinomyces graevenitzii C83]|uniref:N5-carboxyaminoimidazole ribonucleotide synthase n=1 Tax=Actinomyces graevenitzii C83 TaxID=435830 RepID=G9PF37_9ACTO|nr:phosphoribosylaminoimidazole carboxylase, ATPase subunit [Actinomyces graevenitzii C83]
MAVIGGGQLARMMQEEASALGVHLRALVEAPDGSAAQVMPDAPVGRADDAGAVRDLLQPKQGEQLQDLADAAVLTFEHEHQDHALLQQLAAQGVSVQPSAQALLYARDKLEMRRAMTRLELPQPAWSPVSQPAEVLEFALQHGWPVVLKTPQGGYDGHGVLLVNDAAELENGEAAKWFKALADGAGVGGGGSLGGAQVSCLLVEQAVNFTRELAALVARNPSGQVEAWPVVETVQVEGMCDTVLAPAPGLKPATAALAQQVAKRVASELEVTGVLAVEMFVVEGDGGDQLYINELAMRPHNSGHWSQDGALTSQFEQHLRAVLDWPLGSAQLVAPTVMVNVIGWRQETDALLPDPSSRLAQALQLAPQAKIHLYGKQARRGRKLGHVNLSLAEGQDPAQAVEIGRQVAHVLTCPQL